ncbi:aldo/keto reductase [Alphaproteobacteria bacterium]|nr:aldo/keto reductase [Alphaproteobacteria bacterium]
MRKIFGTGTLHWLSPKSRDKVIDTALNNGFSQFDTAGVYGLGSTNKYLGSLGLSRNVFFSAKLGLTSGKTFGFSRLEFLLRKVLLSKLSKIEEDNCYSNWQRQFETQMLDLRVCKVQRLLLHERFITTELWQLFLKFINEYRVHFDEYGVSASWPTLRPTISKVYDEKLLIQTTPDILDDDQVKDLKKLTLYGISKMCNDDNYVKYGKNYIEGFVYFSSKTSRIKTFLPDNKYNG